MTELVWFRNDLRTADNPALTAACQTGRPVEACYIVTPGQWQEHNWAPVRVRFVIDHVNQLAQQLARLGIELSILYADTFSESIAVLNNFCRQKCIQTLHINAEYGVNERQRDRSVHQLLSGRGINVFKYPDQCVVPVGQVMTAQDTPYTVFTPFYRRWRAWLSTNPPVIFPEPAAVGDPVPQPRVDPGSIPPLADAAPGLTTGENSAHERLAHFVAGQVAQYNQNRDFPARAGTSQLSPYLANGVLSGRQCLAGVADLEPEAASDEGKATWIKELAWRDFYIHILYHFPRVSMNRAFKPDTEALHWNDPGEHLQAWQAGNTGIPIVDAAMRQLNQTGWMHNRLRMVTAMYLSKNLFIDWRLGERYFMSKLVDGFLASNNGGWQWSASTGTDAAPYFRIFNPVSQSERFDPDGSFIRRYVPELAGLDNRQIHQPWLGSKLPASYPPPQVDLKESRKEAIARFQALKEG